MSNSLPFVRIGRVIANSWVLSENNDAVFSDSSLFPIEPLRGLSIFTMRGGSTEFLGEGTWLQRESLPQTDSSGTIIGYNFLETKGAWTAVQRNTKSIPEDSLVFALLGLGATAFSEKLMLKRLGK
ncbi:MAG: hypothetical protein KME30_02970 [Iphinoe sp. HA4291-MV1]|jgi:hypothetical protein|nr:hypothetical protein [Iphinoe sp. HA4291-MV1]